MKYPEMRELPWAKEMDQIIAEGKSKVVIVAGGILADQPKVPVELLLSVIKDAANRPEVMAAYASAPTDGQIPPRESHLIIWFCEFLRHKYGNVPDAASASIGPLRELANGSFTGVDDPGFYALLLKSPFVSSGDDENQG